MDARPAFHLTIGPLVSLAGHACSVGAKAADYIVAACLIVIGTPAAKRIASCKNRLIRKYAWIVTGAVSRFNDMRQLAISTVTTVIACLPVFLVRYARNRDIEAQCA